MLLSIIKYGGSMKILKYLVIFMSVLLIIFAKTYAQDLTLNKQPCLYDGVIEPQSGTTRNIYIASVRYYDPDGKKPIQIKVFVNENGYNLKKSSGKYNNGVYKTKLSLPAGKHSYYFYAEDDHGFSIKYPQYGVIKGPTVNLNRPYQQPATLMEGGLYQKIGTNKSIYTYTVRFKDPNEKPPKKIRVVVDGISYPMQLHKGKLYDGIFLAKLTLPTGKHAYYFKAYDALGNCITLPEQGFVRGPDVISHQNSNPKLLDNKIEPPIGYKANTYSYYVTYIDEDNDPPSLMQIYINEQPYDLKLKQGKPYNGIYYLKYSHFVGNYHNYYFYCEDGRGGSYRFPETGYFYGPVVVK